MQPKHRPGITASSFVLTGRSNQQLLDGAKHLVGRHRIVTAHLIAHLAEIYSRKLHVVEGFSYLDQYCVGALRLSEDEANRRAHAAVLAQKYPVILDMLVEGSIHLTTLRVMGKCLTQQNHLQVLNAARGKSKTELEHLAAALCPKADVPTVLRKVPEARLENAQSEEPLFMGGNVGEVVIGTAPQGQASNGVEVSPDQTGVMGTSTLAATSLPIPPTPRKSRLAPLSPRRYNLQVTVDEETYHALKQLQDLLRHQVRNGDLARIIKDAVLERLERVKREKFGHSKRTRTPRKQESWLDDSIVAKTLEEKQTANMKSVEEELIAQARAEQRETSEVGKRGDVVSPEVIAPGRLPMNSRHIPTAVRREVWERDKGQCAFVGRSGRRCSEKGRLEFHHIHAYALGGRATVENIALRCRTHNAHEGVALFGKEFTRPRASGESTRPGANRVARRPGATSP